MDDSVRIGNEEREAAAAELAEHLAAGRLDADEYTERATRASTAVTRADLDALFTDLPRTRATLTPTASAEAAKARRSELTARVFAASGMLAVLVYLGIGFLFHGWAWGWVVFLIVPLVSTLTGQDRKGAAGR